jgi:DNA-binding SARP family transcriptional activator
VIRPLPSQAHEVEPTPTRSLSEFGPIPGRIFGRQSMPPLIRFFALGPLELHTADGTSVRSVLAQPRRTALLAYLATARPVGWHRRDTLLALFWPESDPRRARDLLNTNLSALRSSLGAELVISRGNDEVGLDHERFWSDAGAFDAALAAAQPEAALELYRGELLDGFHLSGAPGFERWLEGERARLCRLAVQAAHAAADGAIERGDRTAARRYAERALELAPDSEASLRRLLELLDAAGDRAAALQRYAIFAERLQAELEVEPSPETQRLVDGMRARTEPAPAGPTSPAGDAADGTRATAKPSAPESLPVESADPGSVAAAAAGVEPVAPPDPERGRHAAPEGRPAGWRLRLSGSHVLAAMVLLAAGLLMAVAAARPRTQPYPSPASAGVIERVAVFPFAARGEGVEFLGEGMMDLLAAKLDGAGSIRVVDPRAVLNRMEEARESDSAPARARVTAGALDATLFILGSVTAQGDSLQIDGKLFRVDPGPGGVDHLEPLARASVGGSRAQVFHLVDVLARELLAERFGEAGQQLARVSAQTTGSMEALRPYLEGESRFRRGDYGGAAERFRSALAADSFFTLAHYRLSGAAAWEGDDVTALAAAARALELAERVPESEARLIRAWHAYLHGQGDVAEQIYRTVVTGSPSNVEAWYRFAEVLFHYGPTRGRPLAEAGEAFGQVLRLEPDHVVALVHRARIAAWSGDLRQLDSLAARLATLDAAESQRLEIEALRAVLHADAERLARVRAELGRGDVAQREAVARSVAAFTSDLAAAALLGDSLGAESHPHPERVTGRLLLAHLKLGQGRWAEAGAHLGRLGALTPALAQETRMVLASLPFMELDRAEIQALRRMLLARPAPDAGYAEPGKAAMQPPWTGGYARGLVRAALGEHAAALDAAEALRGSTAEEALARTLQQRLGNLLAARVHADRGEHARALRELGEPRLLALNVLPDITQHSHAAERYARARLLQQLGRNEEALRWFESFPDPSGYDVVYLAPSHLHRAQIHERNGRLREAREHYARAVRLWSGADAPLRSALEEARAGLRRTGAVR